MIIVRDDFYTGRALSAGLFTLKNLYEHVVDESAAAFAKLSGYGGS